MKRSSNKRLELKIRKTFRHRLVRPRAQPARRHRALAGVRLRVGPSRWFRRVHEANPDACFLARQQLQRLVRLYRSSEGNQPLVGGRDPEPSQRLLGRQA
jgi:hypothetical protein